MQPKTLKHTRTITLAHLLQAYKKRFRAPQKTVITAFCDAAKELFTQPIDVKKVSYTPSSQTIYLNISGAMKQEIKMRETELLASIKKNLGGSNTPKHIL